MTQRKTKAYLRKRRKIKAIIRLCFTVLLIAAIIAGVVIIAGKYWGGQKEEAVVYKPGPPSPAVASTATIAATGDILTHDSVLNGARAEGGFDFTESFAGVAGYWGSYDYMIANLEVPCGGEESGDYRGYPSFNAPDDIVLDLAAAGVDMFLTANNHAYDAGEYGMLRTQDVIKQAGLDYVGTRQSTNDSYVLIKDINNIRFGFACYTYDTRQNPDDHKSLNGITMSDTAVDLINSFTYSNLDGLLTSIAGDLETMKAEKCDVTVFFMHWGNEYQDNPDDAQMYIAQSMCDLGVDVIIGGHPHVIQQTQILNSANGHATFCLYSMGNAISSQRKEIMVPEEPRGYTEDGLTISITYEKFNNGKMRLKDVYILPTWVDQRRDGVYSIVALDQDMLTDRWQTVSLSDAKDSYNRTMERLGEAYPWLRDYLGQPPVKSYIE